MEYVYVLRKYRLQQSQATGYAAKQEWRRMVEGMEPHRLDDFIVDEFPIQDKPKGWLKSLLKQLWG